MTAAPGLVERGRDDHLSARLVELHGVGEQVEQDLAQRALVRHHRRQALQQRQAHDDALLRRLRLHQRDAFAHDAIGVDRRELELQLARLDLGEIEQVVGEAHDVPRRSVDVA